ncbi:thioredoxin-like domain-containing protein [Balneolaceae bacterium ANBcel3]|nr:thioredoxin-like domain-containing protein [Balneolaceae bacterium ANBcel3]
MKRLVFFLILLVGCNSADSQTITGNIPGLAGEDVRLEGFRGFGTHEISRSDVSDDGVFTLPYSADHIGMGLLVSSDDHSFIVVLSGQDIRLKGESLANPETVDIISGEENRLFEQYAREHPRREQALSAWIFLENIYRDDSLFAVHDTPRQAIAREKQRIRDEDQAFLDQLDPSTYVHWYLPVRKLVSSVSVVAQHRTEEIPQTIEAFRQLDYTDQRLHRSGLLSDVLESHVWLIENSGRSLDSVFVELNISIDNMAENLSLNQDRFNEIMEYLFDLLERRSLFTSSEHLALSLLESKSDLLTSRFANKLEIYRSMKIGSDAPDIEFTENTHNPTDTNAGRLSELESDYILVVFAAGWCPDCRSMMPELTEKYPAWNREGVEVVLVSLDDTPESFAEFVSSKPFISTSDLQRWSSPIARDYHVQNIPAMFLMDRSREMLLRPKSVQHMDAWVDWFLVQGNPGR